MTVQEINNLYSVLTFHNTEYPNWENFLQSNPENHEHFGVLQFFGSKNETWENLQLCVFHGLIYDRNTREWVETIDIPNINLLQEFYYVKSENPKMVKGFLFYQQGENKIVLDEFCTLPDLIGEDGQIEIIDHLFYMMHYRDHALLFGESITL